ncbi:hypothetical protein Tco_0590216 [Tanacetum coccineum]
MANKHSIMTREMVESFCNSYYIPDEVHPTAPGRDRTITQFPEGKVGVYTRLFDYCGYRIPLTKFFVSVLKYFRIHISQLSPFGAARISHFEVLTRVLDLGSSVAVFRAFYTRMYSDGLFSFAKRSLSAPSCLSKPPDSIKNWADHFFWVDSRVFPISVPLYTGGVLEKDPAPHLTARQEQAVQVLSSNKAPFRRYPECFLALVGLSPYYPFGENTYPAFEGPDRTNMGLLDYMSQGSILEVQHSVLSSQAHTLLSSQPPPHSPPPRSTATRWSDTIKLLSARVKEEMWCCEHHAKITVMPGTEDRGCGYFMWMDDLRLHISSSSGSSTPPSYSPGTSTRPSYSPGSSRSVQNLGKAECSNCKFLAEKIKTLEAKIKILEGALEMEMHPEKHTLDSAAILHELYNDMGKLGLE